VSLKHQCRCCWVIHNCEALLAWILFENSWWVLIVNCRSLHQMDVDAL
jgi:hypothetical protein